MSYDNWKTTNPADCWSEPEWPDDEPKQSECDCCGKMVPVEEISFVVAFGIDTFACDECRGA